jgi:hypothetical protein
MPKGIPFPENERRVRHKLYMKKYNHEYYLTHLESEKTRRIKYRQNNREKLALKEKERDPVKEKARRKKYNAENREKINLYIRNRYKDDKNYRLVCILRARLYSTVKGKQKAGSAVRDLGCTIEEFKAYIESKFLPGMSWNNWSYKGWHIDHSKPLSLFNLEDREQFLKACHYTNMQPMWSMENHIKGNRYAGI